MPSTDDPVVRLTQLSYPVAEAATLIRCSRATIYNLMARGELRSVKVGRSRRIPRDEIARLTGQLDPTASGGAA